MKAHATSLISLIPALGVLCQWLAWRLRFPSILILLVVGFLVGPVFNIINPDKLLGQMIVPIVSLSVAIIMFEGGLSLKFSDLKNTGKVVRNLITTGALITWILTAFFSYYLLQLPLNMSILFGAILIVTGPTVIIPLLKHIRLKRSLSSILRWEGIMIDPVGATCAVLVFEILQVVDTSGALSLVAFVLLTTLAAGVILGGISAFILIFIFKRQWIPDFLQEAITLTLVIGSYAISDMIQAESGLLTVTIMGIVLANQKVVTIKHIVHFKENLTVILLSSLFILLAARIDMADIISNINWQSGLFLVALIVVVRPVSILVATFRSNLPIRDSIFLAGLAPRGIVAAAVASLFSIRLVELGVPGAEKLVPYTFMVIVSTVTVYGIFGKPFANLLGLQSQEKGILLVGAHELSVQIGKLLTQLGLHVVLVDSNKENIINARESGIPSIHGSILSQRVLEEVEVGSVGRLIALTSSDETNLLSAIEYANLFGTQFVYRLFPKDKRQDFLTKKAEGSFLFGKGMTYTYLSTLMTSGAYVEAVEILPNFSYQAYAENNPRHVLLFVYNKKKQLQINTFSKPIMPKVGMTIIALVTPSIVKSESSNEIGATKTK